MSAILKFHLKKNNNNNNNNNNNKTKQNKTKKKKTITFSEENHLNYTKRHSFACDDYIFP